MQITAEMFSLFRLYSGGERQITLEVDDGARVGDALQSLGKRYGSRFERTLFPEESGTLADEVNVLLNGRNVSLMQGLHTPLSDRDRVTLLVTMTGG